MSAQSNFGAGYPWATGSVYAAPLLLGALQDISVDESQELKPLYGQLQSPLEQGTGKRKTEIKVALARLDPNLFNQVYYGGTITTGQTLASNMEKGTIPAVSGPYTITVAQSATWATDLGVYNVNTGKFMTKVRPARRPQASTRSRPASTPSRRPTPSRWWRSATPTPRPAAIRSRPATP